jgi:hypothetical protein
MELEKQCCTVEQAKELVRLGVKVETINIWYFDPNLHEWKITGWETQYYWESSNLTIEWYPAPNVAELGVLLGDLQVLRVTKYGRNFKESYWAISNWGMLLTIYLHCDVEKNENEMRARALIKLINDGEINPKELRL